ncbi:hypothetical protein PG993_008451 [Apiospora rasikravindrae]|uniref:Zn(2)-C6 fungal-type domain-containing protein n=1 Tax=Apiospora rasikravindrae TaxID=990691 RepID=A0ABR1T261_9PEZI
MSTSDLKSSLHRFRVSRTEPTFKTEDSPSSMPPPPLAHEQPRSAVGGPATPPIGGAGDSYHNQPTGALPPAPTSSSKSIPACDRCRSFKKKCSRTFPVCSLCASAGQRCSFSTPASSTNAQVHHLRARVEWLSRYINEALPIGPAGIEAVETGTDISELLLLQGTSPGLSQNGQSPAASVMSAAVAARQAQQHQQHHQQQQQHQLPPMHDDHPMMDHSQSTIEVNMNNSQTASSPDHHSIAHGSVGSYSDARSVTSTMTAQRLPPDAAARRFVDAYFRNVNRAYPFVDRNKILHDLEVFGDFAQRRRDADSTLLYLIMAIGCTTLQRAGQIPDDTALRFDVAYSDIIQECLCRESIESIQILVLLALYSLFDPAGASAWSIVGIVSRQAMLLGLSRRASDETALSATAIELRHRLFWSIYVLDRMMATSLGLPVALTDENMDVPLPGLTVEEFASAERSHFATILQTSRHVIQLRQMEDRILRHVHFRRQAEVSSLTYADRRAILQEMRADIENWYSNGCLVSPLEPDNVPIHNSITWLSARYYYLLLLLYYPSHFNSPPNNGASRGDGANGGIVSKAELLRFAQKHLQSTSALFHQRQLPLNRVTLCRLLPVGLVLIRSFLASSYCNGEGAMSRVGTGAAGDMLAFAAREDVVVLTSILDAFPDGWDTARRGAQILRQFLGLLTSISAAPPRTTTPGSCQDMMRPVVSAYLALMQDVLGKASCYRFLDVPEDDDGELGAASSQQPHQQQPPPTAMRGRTPSVSMSGTDVGGVLTNENSVTNYVHGNGGWGSIELDFL